MLKHLLNESAVLKSVETVDEYGSSVISDIKTVNCKIEFAYSQNDGTDSSLLEKPARMFCVEEVKIGDIVYYNQENYQVLQVNTYKDLDGKIMLREVYLK